MNKPKQNLFEGEIQMSERERRDTLLSQSYSIEQMSFHKPLTPEELALHKDNLAQYAIKRQALEEQLKAYADDIKARIKGISLQFSETLHAIKTGGTQVEGEVFMIDDQENKLMLYYDIDGNLLSSRALLPNERQTSIMTATRNASNF